MLLFFFLSETYIRDCTQIIIVLLHRSPHLFNLYLQAWIKCAKPHWLLKRSNFSTHTHKRLSGEIYGKCKKNKNKIKKWPKKKIIMATYIAALTSVGCIFKSTAVLNGRKRDQPHPALQSADFSGHCFRRLGGIVQLSLDPPTGGFGSCQIFFGLLQLMFQLTHSVGCLFGLCADARVSAPSNTVSDWIRGVLASRTSAKHKKPWKQPCLVFVLVCIAPLVLNLQQHFLLLLFQPSDHSGGLVALPEMSQSNHNELRST